MKSIINVNVEQLKLFSKQKNKEAIMFTKLRIAEQIYINLSQKKSGLDCHINDLVNDIKYCDQLLAA